MQQQLTGGDLLRFDDLPSGRVRVVRGTPLQNPTDQDSASLTPNLVHVQETTPASEEIDPLEWFLLTSQAEAEAEAEQIIDAYRLRRAITIKAVIAWRLLLMTLLDRDTPEPPAKVLFSDLEIRVLPDVAQEKKKPPPDHLEGVYRDNLLHQCL